MELLVGLSIVSALFILWIVEVIINIKLRMKLRTLESSISGLKSSYEKQLNHKAIKELDRMDQLLYTKISPVDYRFKNEHEILQETSPIDYLTK